MFLRGVSGQDVKNKENVNYHLRNYKGKTNLYSGENHLNWVIKLIITNTGIIKHYYPADIMQQEIQTLSLKQKEVYPESNQVYRKHKGQRNKSNITLRKQSDKRPDCRNSIRRLARTLQKVKVMGFKKNGGSKFFLWECLQINIESQEIEFK